jgi:tetratricopeptide (TPR) repeat protein
MRRLALLALAVVLASLTALSASRLAVAGERPYDIALIPKAGVLRWLSAGHTTLAANAYYLRAVQYIGELRSNERGWDKLYPVLDLVTDLDPKHGYAYQVGGVLLGSVDRVDESNALLEKGTRNLPDRYILPYLRAFNAFYYDGDFETAGRFAEAAAVAKNAPPHVRSNVLAYYVKGHRPEAAIAFLTNLLAEARDDETREALEAQLKQAYLERDAALIERAVEIYRAAIGVRPALLEMLVAAGLLSDIPTDPFGGRYYVDGEGRVRSTANEFRYQRPIYRLGREPGVRPDTYEEMLR